jgi:hypothetical protein
VDPATFTNQSMSTRDAVSIHSHPAAVRREQVPCRRRSGQEARDARAEVVVTGRRIHARAAVGEEAKKRYVSLARRPRAWRGRKRPTTATKLNGAGEWSETMRRICCGVMVRRERFGRQRNPTHARRPACAEWRHGEKQRSTTRFSIGPSCPHIVSQEKNKMPSPTSGCVRPILMMTKSIYFIVWYISFVYYGKNNKTPAIFLKST